MNLMIVDDDIQIREGIQYGIDWDTIGITGVKSYGDGIEALEDYDDFAPQIILADIRMPAMDGLEFLKCVKERSKAVKVILISAYSDFEYCQKAIQLGASGYELKPLKVGSLIQKIQEMTDLVRKEAEGKEAYDRYVASYREKLVEELFTGMITDRNVIIELLRMHFQLEDARNLICMVMAEDKGTEGLGDEIRQYLHSLLRNDQILLEFRNQLVVLTKTKDSALYTLERQNHMKNLWYQIKQYVGSKGMSLSAGISGMVPAEQICAGYEAALQALGYRFLNGPGSFQIMDRQGKKEMAGLCLPPEYEAGLKKHDLPELLNAVNMFGTVVLKSENTDLKQIKDLIMNGIVRLAQEMDQHAGDGRALEDAAYLSVCLQLWRTECERIMKAHEESCNANYSSNIRKAIAYIHEHYAKDLLVEEVAAYIGKTPNYFSSIFRMEVGMTFREYLNHYRIERARELIEGSDMMIYEIAEQVGYSDYTYFSQVFKKVTGISPTSLRGRLKI